MITGMLLACGYSFVLQQVKMAPLSSTCVASVLSGLHGRYEAGLRWCRWHSWSICHCGEASESEITVVVRTLKSD